MLSSAVKSYHLALVGSQQWQLLIFWGASLTSSSKESTLPLAVEFSLNYLWLLGTVLNAGLTRPPRVLGLKSCAPPLAKRGTSL